ncbi:MAG: hypothetical protein A2X34_10785 [Elusimicrobia bacterium GWC2_51_8]|nr:MAG: hypothetical protein A2X34_10785 [Elusimicrobia bacterium GWC2_51_8]
MIAGNDEPGDLRQLRAEKIEAHIKLYVQVLQTALQPRIRILKAEALCPKVDFFFRKTQGAYIEG